MESPGLSDPKQPKDDVSQSSSSAANVDRSETPDSNRGPGDDESAADSPKITKPVLGKAQAKKRLMAFANKFPPSVIQKPVEKSFSFNKNRNINSFQVNKKKSKDSIKNLVTDVSKSKNRVDIKMETIEKNDVQLPTRSSPTKKSKKRVETKIAAIEEIIREDAKQKLLLTNYLIEKKNDIDNFILNSDKNDDKNDDKNNDRNDDKNNDRNDNRNNDRNDERNNDRNDDRNNDRNDDRNNERNDDRNDRNKNFGRHQQWDRRNQYFHNDNFRRGNFNQNYYGDRKFNDRRWQFNDFRDRSRSRERRNDNFIRNRRRSNSLEMDQQHKMKIHKHDKPYFNRHRNYNNHRKEKREEQFEPIEKIDWRSFKRQGGQVRARSLSVDINEGTNTPINKEVKFKTPQEYNAQLHHMLMIGTHHVKRTCVTVDGINETKKQYPPESIRITKKCNGQGLFYCENPNISLLLPCQQLYQMLPPDRSDRMRKISHAVAGSSKEYLDQEEQGPRKWFGQIHNAEPRQAEYEVKDIDKSLSPVNSAEPPKSRWDSEDEAAAAVDDSSSSSSESQSETSDNEEDDGNKKEEGDKEEEKDKVIKITPIVKEDVEEEVADNGEKAEKDEEEDKVDEDEDEEMSSTEKVNLTPASSVNEIMPNEDVSNEMESDKVESNEEISSKGIVIEVVSSEITTTPITDNSDDKSREKVEVGEKLVSEYEQFMKMVANEEEADNTEDIVQTVENESPIKVKVESKVVINPPISDECSKKTDDQDVEHASDTQNLDPVVESALLINSKNNSESTPVKIEKIDKTIELDPGISDWANIRGTTKHRRSSKSDKLRKKKERKKKKYRKKVSSSDSSDSSSSSSESEDEKRKRKRKRKRKKKRTRDSSSDSSSSDSDDSSDESSHSSKKKRKKRKNRKKLRLRNKKKRARKDSNVSNSSFEFDEITRKRKKRKDSKQRKVSKRRRSKSTEKKRLQKMNRESKNKIENESLEVVIKEEVSHSPHWEAEVNKANVSVALSSTVTQITGSLEDKASAKPITKVPSAEKLFQVWDNNSSSQVASQQPDDLHQEEPKVKELEQEEISNEVVNEDTAVVEHEHKSIKDIESVHHSPVDKPSDVIEINTDTVSDQLSEKKSKRDSSRSKKVKKIKKKRRSISTSSTSSNSSSGSSDSDSNKKKKSRDKRKKKNRSKRRSPSQSELIKKLKKYRAKLSESLDFDALHFPSLTQLEESNENLPVVNDWEVDSLDALEKFASNSSKDKSTAKIDKKLEKGLLYDSKTDTYIAIEKNKTQRENKKKQVNRICPLRIWEDEEEEGEREAKMLMEEKIKKENELKVQDEQSTIEPVASSPIPNIVEEEKEEESKPVDLPDDSAKIKDEDAKEEKPSGWVEIIPESEDKAVEIVPEQQVPLTTRWAEPSPVLLKEEEDLEDDNLAPVNWEEEEVDWESQSSFITGVKSAKASKSRRESSDSSSDSSDSSSSSESSDSDTQNDKRSRHKHDSSSKSKYSGSKNPSPAVETEAMKKLRMNIFAQFAAPESTGDFTQLPDTEIDINISPFKLSPEELLSSKSVEANKSIESSEILIPKFDDTRFVTRDRTDSTVEKGTFRQSFQEVRLRSYSRSPECDSKRSSSSRNDNEKSKTRSSEDRGSASSYRSSSRGSVKDRSKIDNKDFKGSSFNTDHKKISPLSDRGFKDKKRSPVSWNRSRSRSRSWSRSRSRTPSRRDDRLSWDRQKRIGRIDDKRERFSRSPDRRGRLKAFTSKDRSHRSTESDRNRERDYSCDKSHERDWSREKLGNKSYDPMEILRGSYNIDKKRPSDLTERPHDALDMYHKNINLEKDSDTPFTSELDKPRYRSRSRSRERRSRDIDWDRSRESPDSCRGTRVSDSRKSSRLSPRSRGSPPRSSGRSRYAGRSRSRSWSRSRSRSRSRSISRFRSRSRSSSRSRSRLGLRNSDRSRRSLDRSRHSRSFSPEQRKLNIISDIRYRRSTSKERIQKIETIIHPSGINSLSHEESQNVPQIDDSNNIPVPTQQFEYSYYGGNNLTYPPRLETTTITTPVIAAAAATITTTTTINPPVSSPKRLSLDDRLELELGIKKNQESLPPPLPPLPPPPPPHPYNIPKYNQQTMAYPPTPGVPVLQPRIPAPLHAPYVRPQQPTVLQVGNVLQVVPADFSGPVPPVGIRNDIPTPPSSTGNNNTNRTLRVGNVIQVVPSTSLDWSGPVPPPAPAPTPTLAPSLPPLPMSSVPIAVPVPVPMPIGTNVPVLPAVSLPMMVPVPSISHIQPIPPPPPPLPPPIAALPKLEPPKAPPLLQPIYNYEAIMEVRRKEKEERKRLREEKRLEKERKKIEKMRRRAKRTLGQSSSRITADLPIEPDTTIEGEAEIVAVSAQPKPLIDDEDLDDPIAAPLGQPDENAPEDEDEEEEYDEGDVEEDDEEEDEDEEPEAEVEDDESRVINLIDPQPDVEIPSLNETVDEESTSNANVTVTTPLPPPPRKGILVPPGLWDERIVNGVLDDDSNTASSATEVLTQNNSGDQLPTNLNEEKEDEVDPEEKRIRTLRQRRSRKSVQFADGIKPGEGTSPSGGEGDMPSPPPPAPMSLHDPLHEHIRRSRSRKNRKKAKRAKPLKIKKKVKVKIIKLKKPKITPLTSMMLDDLDDLDDRSPPPPPPGSPPPPHLWPSYLAAYSAILRPVETTSSPSTNQAPPPPTPLPLLVPPPPLNYTIQPCNKA